MTVSHRFSREVVILGFGKGAGIALYASLLNVFPQVRHMHQRSIYFRVQLLRCLQQSSSAEAFEKKLTALDICQPAKNLRSDCAFPIVPG